MPTEAITYRRARQFRRQLTPAEARLWTALRRRFLGVRFRRQHPIGPYILDFYCPEQRLAVEVDGLIHDADGQIAHDERRTAWLTRQGVRVIRCTNLEVRDALDSVLACIADEIIP